MMLAEPNHVVLNHLYTLSIKVRYLGSRHSFFIICTLLHAKAGAAVARLSHCNSVRPSVTRVDQSKTVQARITKFSLLAAWKTLVSGSVKLFHKFERGQPQQGR